MPRVGRTGSVNEVRFFNNVPDTVEDGLARIDEIGRPDGLQPLPLGLDACRATHRFAAGNARPTGAAPPIRSSSPGRAGIAARRDQDALRPHHRHGADRARCARVDPPPAIAGVTQSPIEGVVSGTPSTTPPRPPITHPVLRDARAPLDLPRRLACRMSLAGNVIRRIRAHVR